MTEMSVSIRTAAVRPLSLVKNDHPRGGGGHEELKLAPSAQLTRFIDTAARSGLIGRDAVPLGIERALVLMDASKLARDLDASRRALSCAAREARPERGLSPDHAAWVRVLTTRRPVPTEDVSEGLSVAVPDRVLCRAAGVVPVGSLHAGAVGEMIAWELAATLAARSMSEWALFVWARERRAD